MTCARYSAQVSWKTEVSARLPLCAAGHHDAHAIGVRPSVCRVLACVHACMRVLACVDACKHARMQARWCRGAYAAVRIHVRLRTRPCGRAYSRATAYAPLQPCVFTCDCRPETSSRTHRHTRTERRRHRQTQTHTHTHTQTQTHAHAHTHNADTRTHARAHTRNTHARTHAHAGKVRSKHAAVPIDERLSPRDVATQLVCGNRAPGSSSEKCSSTCVNMHICTMHVELSFCRSMHVCYVHRIVYAVYYLHTNVLCTYFFVSCT